MIRRSPMIRCLKPVLLPSPNLKSLLPVIHQGIDELAGDFDVGEQGYVKVYGHAADDIIVFEFCFPVVFGDVDDHIDIPAPDEIRDIWFPFFQGPVEGRGRGAVGAEELGGAPGGVEFIAHLKEESGGIEKFEFVPNRPGGQEHPLLGYPVAY